MPEGASQLRPAAAKHARATSESMRCRTKCTLAAVRRGLKSESVRGLSAAGVRRPRCKDSGMKRRSVVLTSHTHPTVPELMARVPNTGAPGSLHPSSKLAGWNILYRPNNLLGWLACSCHMWRRARMRACRPERGGETRTRIAPNHVIDERRRRGTNAPRHARGRRTASAPGQDC